MMGCNHKKNLKLLRVYCPLACHATMPDVRQRIVRYRRLPDVD